MTTVKEIVVAALKEMGADGLSNEIGCGCGLDDLMPCYDACAGCVPALLSDPPEGEAVDEWYAPMTDEEITANLEKRLYHNMKCGDPYRIGDHSHHCVTSMEDENEPQEPPENET
jgi:hypothetical protein